MWKDVRVSEKRSEYSDYTMLIIAKEIKSVKVKIYIDGKAGKSLGENPTLCLYEWEKNDIIIQIKCTVR